MLLKMQTQSSIVSQSESEVHGDDFVYLSDDDGLKHIDGLLTSKYTAKDMETLGFEDSDVKSLLLLNRVFKVGVVQTGQYLDIEPDLRHAPLIISESGRNTKTKAVSTPREKLQDTFISHFFGYWFSYRFSS